jgi:predicted nucleic-acid-binding protein
VRLTVDTNVLIRAIVQDDENQAAIASRVLREAELVVIPNVVLCEMVWVLRRLYGFATGEVAEALKVIASTENVELNRSTFAAGMAMLENGGDFADGVIANEGQWLGGEVFVSFDKEAVALLKDHRQAALSL